MHFHDLVERFGLRRGSRESVENVSLAVFVFADILGYDVDNQFVRSQMPLVDVTFHTSAQRRFLPDLFPDDFSGRDVVKTVFFDQFGCLRSLSGPRRAEQYNVQHRVKI